jgi:hypothetical protein
MSSPETAPALAASSATAPGLASDAARVLEDVGRLVGEGRVGEVPDEAVQQLLLAAVRLFAARRGHGPRLPAFETGAVTATEAAVTAVALTEAVNLELFELALWNGWSDI